MEVGMEQDKRPCSAKRFDGYYHQQCQRSATVVEDGQAFCRQHAPSLVLARYAVRHQKWEAKWAAEDKVRELKQQADVIAGLVVEARRNGLSLPAEVAEAADGYIAIGKREAGK